MFLLMEKWSLNLRLDRKINNITPANQANITLKHLVLSTKFVINVAASSCHKGVREIAEIIHRYNLSMNDCDCLDLFCFILK